MELGNPEKNMHLSFIKIIILLLVKLGK